jgi:hypothetical protein
MSFPVGAEAVVWLVGTPCRVSVVGTPCRVYVVGIPCRVSVVGTPCRVSTDVRLQLNIPWHGLCCELRRAAAPAYAGFCWQQISAYAGAAVVSVLEQRQLMSLRVGAEAVDAIPC